MNMSYFRLEQDVFNRWIIVHPERDDLAWSGSCWVPHHKGVGTVAQISNFSSREDADTTAHLQIVPPLGAA